VVVVEARRIADHQPAAQVIPVEAPALRPPQAGPDRLRHPAEPAGRRATRRPRWSGPARRGRSRPGRVCSRPTLP
jgi:hypothetical protein